MEGSKNAGMLYDMAEQKHPENRSAVALVRGFLVPIPAPSLWTPYQQSVLSRLFYEERRFAERALLRDRLIPQGKGACRIVAAAVKGLPLSASPLDNDPLTAFLGASDSCLPGSRRLTGGII